MSENSTGKQQRASNYRWQKKHRLQHPTWQPPIKYHHTTLQQNTRTPSNDSIEKESPTISNISPQSSRSNNIIKLWLLGEQIWFWVTVTSTRRRRSINAMSVCWLILSTNFFKCWKHILTIKAGYVNIRALHYHINPSYISITAQLLTMAFWNFVLRGKHLLNATKFSETSDIHSTFPPPPP